MTSYFYMIPGSPHHQYPRQHSNIRAAIELYENSKLDGSKVLIVGGEVVSNEDTLKADYPCEARLVPCHI